MLKLLIHFDNQQVTILRKLSTETGVPVARLVRQAVDQFLDNRVPCGFIISGQIASGCALLVGRG